jgi:hypothetical protein
MTVATVTILLTGLAIALAAIPAVMLLANLRQFRNSPPPPANLPPVSVLVPARNEQAAIGQLIDDVLASEGIDFELVILDDASTDDTATIVAAAAARDDRVRLIPGRTLPPGWCGKQHACFQLAGAARYEALVFLDADVRLTADALARGVGFLKQTDLGLASGFPRQETPCFLAWLLLPLIHFVLLGFLPLGRSRLSIDPALAAGCGQFFITTKPAYERAGGHAAIAASLHDGIMLPRAYRRTGLQTDIFDATDVASCRMYETSREVFNGLAKNATEGIGSPRTILPFTVLLAGGQVLPTVLLLNWLAGWPSAEWSPVSVALVLLAVGLSLLPRLLAVGRFQQSLISSLLQPLAITMFLVIQWYALSRRCLGLQTSWKGRQLAPQ